jgi:Cu2+-exporting ATPase
LKSPLKKGFEQTSIVHKTLGRLRLKARILKTPGLDVTLIESAVGSVKGVTGVRINQKAASMVVMYDEKISPEGEIFDVLHSLEYSIFSDEEEELKTTTDSTHLYWVITMQVLKMFTPPLLKPVVSLIGAVPVLSQGVETLVSKGLKVEVLDATVISMLLLKRDYFTAGWLNFMLTLGHYLEESTEHKSNTLLKSLIKPDIEDVWIINGSVEKKIKVDDLAIGDIVIVGPGEMIPVDGTLSHGSGTVNQSSLTGESLPITPSQGDSLYSGTVVVEGKLFITAEKVGTDTTSARIAKFISNSLKNSSQTETKAFKMADRLVPFTFAAGLGVFAFTRSIHRASSVLSVDYSCALKLVTPTAMKASMYKAGSEGILIKGAPALESLASLNTIIFDKTGTLTKGNLAVQDIISYGDFSRDELLKIAASAEEHYSHPIAAAVVAEAENRGIELAATGEVDFIIAHGVSAYVDDKKVMVGSHHFIAEDEGIECSFSDDDAAEFHSKGNSVLFIAVEGILAGIISLQDELRPEAMEVISSLKAKGIENVVMLTGDHKEAALHIGNKLGIDNIYYELKPDDKANIVKELKDKGAVSAFIGDGVNDAPALLSAEVGISLPQGADLARETAQVLLLRDDLHGLVGAKEIADDTMKVVNRVFKANIGINSLTVALSLMGLLSPLQSSIAHNGTTIGTLLYALGLSKSTKKGDSDVKSLLS